MTRKNKFDFDCAVVGGGPGGITAAIYLRRFCRSVALVNFGEPRANWIPRTHNLIGYDQGLSGPALMKRLRRQIGKLGVENFQDEAVVSKLDRGFEVCCGSARFRTPKVIFATGICDTLPKLSDVKMLKRSLVFAFCPICDAYEHRGKVIAVLVQDEEGFKKALFIRPYAVRLIVVYLGTKAISLALKEKLAKTSTELLQGQLLALEKTERGEGLWIHVAGHKVLKVSVAYCELGSEVKARAFADLANLSRTSTGRLLTKDHQQLSIEGAYGVGDCTAGLSQLAVAAGQAAIAATHIQNTLDTPNCDGSERQRT